MSWINDMQRLRWAILFFVSFCGWIKTNPTLNAVVHLDVSHACALGFTQGITEFLPVSSTGHMILVNELFLKSSTDYLGKPLNSTQIALNHYMVCIQLGTIWVLLLFYRREIKKMFAGLMGKNNAGLRLAFHVAVAFVPVGLLGFIGGDWIQTHLYNRSCVLAAVLVGGMLIFFVENYRKHQQIRWTLDNMPTKVALGIGLFQLIALWPGFSRSLATIIGGVVLGMSLVQSVHFSFLLGLLTSAVATGYKFLKSGSEMLQHLDVISMLMGVMIAFAVGMITIHAFLGYLKKNGLSLFGYYRLGLAVIFTIFAK
ncbi:MAG: undecaprenyl-diphosphate phosphatase [Puniceicoccales bacterium]|jgi:undecaprenyl-diphosphatase|nr:undecaprenyl-diphosphate phosphatase [Puniceicoccales bacterium]